jgi:hypothetical protein
MRALDICHFGTASEREVRTCDPRLQTVLRYAIRCAPAWLDFAVPCGHRGEKAQNQAVADGNSTLLWPNGKHNSLPSLAADVRPASPFTVADWEDQVRFGRLMGFIEAVALEIAIPVRLGLDWNRDGRSIDEKLKDLGHIELIV